MHHHTFAMPWLSHGETKPTSHIFISKAWSPFKVIFFHMAQAHGPKLPPPKVASSQRIGQADKSSLSSSSPPHPPTHDVHAMYCPTRASNRHTANWQTPCGKLQGNKGLTAQKQHRTFKQRSLVNRPDHKSPEVWR